MTKLIFGIFIVIVSIEFNLAYINNENAPNIVRAWDSAGNEVELLETRQKIDGVWFWRVETENGEYSWSFISWQN